MNDENGQPGSGEPIELHLTVDNADATVVDVLAASSGLSRQQIRQAMDKGAVWLTHGKGTRRVRRRKARLRVDDSLHLYYNAAVLAAQVPAATLVADQGGYSVWVKPAGMRSQGSRWGDHSTLGRWAEKQLQPQRSAFIVHRLDRAASGLMLLAHDKRTAAALAALFRQRRVTKRYQAQVRGAFPQDPDGLRMDDALDGRDAHSVARQLSYDAERDCSLLEVEISTGRKHQIRRHLAGVGHPVVGDRLYGDGDSSDDLQLAAVYLGFKCPLSGQQRVYCIDPSAPIEDPPGVGID